MVYLIDAELKEKWRDTGFWFCASERSVREYAMLALPADALGFSGMIGRDETGTLERLRGDAIEPLIANGKTASAR